MAQSQRTQMIIFLLVFVAIYFSLHSYVIVRLLHLAQIQTSYVTWILITFATLSFILATVLEKQIPNKFTRLVYIVAASWGGVIFIAFALLLCAEIVLLFFPLYNIILSKTVVTLTVLLTITSLINAQLIRIKKLQLPIKHIKKDLHLVQLTDLHLGTVHTRAFLDKIVKRVNALKPELVVITGDLFDGSAPVTKETVLPINNIKAPVYFVIGNHEIYDDLKRVLPVIATTKAKILRNQKANFKGLSIIGVDYDDEKAFMPSILAKLKPSTKKANILLYHAPPRSLEDLEKNNISLHLAGHTHYGQIFPFNFLVRTAFKYVGGLYSTETTKLYIAPGTGTWGPPMRLGSRSEITYITLKKTR